MFAQIYFLNMLIFRHKHKKVGSIFLKSLIMEAFMLPLNFDELNTKLKNF
jgi:hypothetical protein